MSTSVSNARIEGQQRIICHSAASGCALRRPRHRGRHAHALPIWYVSVDSPTWHFSRSYFSASRTAVQHDCLALIWRTVLAVQRRHWSPWTCGMHTSLHSCIVYAVLRGWKLARGCDQWCCMPR
jgi:hypothetical protein